MDGLHVVDDARLGGRLVGAELADKVEDLLVDLDANSMGLKNHPKCAPRKNVQDSILLQIIRPLPASKESKKTYRASHLLVHLG